MIERFSVKEVIYLLLSDRLDLCSPLSQKCLHHLRPNRGRFLSPLIGCNVSKALHQHNSRRHRVKKIERKQISAAVIILLLVVYASLWGKHYCPFNVTSIFWLFGDIHSLYHSPDLGPRDSDLSKSQSKILSRVLSIRDANLNSIKTHIFFFCFH